MSDLTREDLEMLLRRTVKRAIEGPHDEVSAQRFKRRGMIEVNSPHDCNDPTSPPPFRRQKCRCNTPSGEGKHGS